MIHEQNASTCCGKTDHIILLSFFVPLFLVLIFFAEEVLSTERLIEGNIVR